MQTMYKMQDFNSSANDWFVRDCGDEIVTLQCRDTGQVATMHFDELEAIGGADV